MILWTATLLAGCLPSATLHDAGMRFLSTAFSQRCCFNATVGNHTADGHTVLKEGMGKGKKEGVSIRVAQSLGVRQNSSRIVRKLVNQR